MDLWKALAEVTKNDRNRALAQQIASVNIDFTKNALNAILLDKMQATVDSLQEVRI